MSLQDDIDQERANAKEMIPPEIFAEMEKANILLAVSGIESEAIGEGDRMPDFALPNAKGEIVNLTDLLKDGPLVISFYRGGWCPYCNLELRALQQSLPEIRDLGASLVAISPEKPDTVGETASQNEVEFEVLSDLGNVLAEKCGLVFTLSQTLQPVYEQFGVDFEARYGDKTYRLPLPGTYVVDQDGTVLKAFAAADYRERLEPSEVVEALRARSQGA